METVKEMQVMWLMVNRCDSMLETQSCLKLLVNSTKQRAGRRNTPFEKKKKIFGAVLASHHDDAETLALYSGGREDRRSSDLKAAV